MKRNSLIGKILGFSLVSVISAILSIVVVPVSTHVYGMEDLGKINFFFTVVSIAYTVFCMGLDQGYVRYYPLVEGEGKNRLLTFNLILCSSALAVVALACLVFQDSLSEWLFGETGKPAIAWLLPTLLCLIVLRFISLRYRMEDDVLHYTVFAGMLAVFQKGLYILSAFVDAGYETALCFVATAALLVVVASLIWERKSFALPMVGENRTVYKEQCKFSAPLLLSSAMVLITNYLPQLAIRSYLGFSDISVYTAAVTVAMAVQLIQSGFNTFWAPYVFKNYEKQTEKIRQVHEGVVMMSVIACIALALLSEPIFVLFKPEYASGACIVPLLSLAPLCYTIGETVGVGILLKMKTGYNLVISITALAVNLCLSVVLIPVLGLKGAALAVGATGITNLAMKTIIGERLYRSINTWTFMVKGMGMYLIVCLAALVFSSDFVVKEIIQIACLAIVCVLFGKEKLSWAASKLLEFVRG